MDKKNSVINENVGKARYGVIENGVFGTRIVAGIVTGIRYTETEPVYEISQGSDKWWTSIITEKIEDVLKALKIESLEVVEAKSDLKINFGDDNDKSNKEILK